MMDKRCLVTLSKLIDNTLMKCFDTNYCVLMIKCDGTPWHLFEITVKGTLISVTADEDDLKLTSLVGRLNLIVELG
jgi:hypothetical protein